MNWKGIYNTMYAYSWPYVDLSEPGSCITSSLLLHSILPAAQKKARNKIAESLCLAHLQRNPPRHNKHPQRHHTDHRNSTSIDIPKVEHLAVVQPCSPWRKWNLQGFRSGRARSITSCRANAHATWGQGMNERWIRTRGRWGKEAVIGICSKNEACWGDDLGILYER